MCRILYLRSGHPVPVSEHLQTFARIARNSSEYQGDGWGIARRDGQNWRVYKNTCPIWEDSLHGFGQSHEFLAHVRSAFRDSPVIVENNMPFENGEHVYAFNGELHGVKLNLPGNTGAEKIFNLILRIKRNELSESVRDAMTILKSRSRYIRAANILIAGRDRAAFGSFYNQDAGYFTMHRKTLTDIQIICSEPYPGEVGWEPIGNDTVGILNDIA
jgi:predicted glutamine amidotransferase